MAPHSTWLTLWQHVDGYRGWFFNCSAKISVLKRKILLNQQGSFGHPEFHGTESLIGCPSFFILVLKIGRTVKKITLYVATWQDGDTETKRRAVEQAEEEDFGNTTRGQVRQKLKLELKTKTKTKIKTKTQIKQRQKQIHAERKILPTP